MYVKNKFILTALVGVSLIYFFTQTINLRRELFLSTRPPLSLPAPLPPPRLLPPPPGEVFEDPSASTSEVKVKPPTKISSNSLVITTNWTTDTYPLWGPGATSDEGAYWKISLSLPPDFTYVSSGSEELLQVTQASGQTWALGLAKSDGSPRENYRKMIERSGGLDTAGKPTTSCSIARAKEEYIQANSSYLDVSVSCQSPNSDGTIYTDTTSAYLYEVDGMLLIISKSTNASDEKLITPYIQRILSTVKISQ